MTIYRYPYTKRLKIEAKIDTGIETILDEKVGYGKIIVLKTVTVEDETSDLTYVRIGKVSAGYFHLWEETQNLPADELAFTTEEHWIRAGERFRADLNGGAANDVCVIYLDGYWFYSDKEQ